MNSSRSFDWRGLVLPLLLLAAWTVATALPSM